MALGVSCWWYESLTGRNISNFRNSKVSAGFIRWNIVELTIKGCYLVSVYYYLLCFRWVNDVMDPHDERLLLGVDCPKGAKLRHSTSISNVNIVTKVNFLKFLLSCYLHILLSLSPFVKFSFSILSFIRHLPDRQVDRQKYNGANFKRQCSVPRNTVQFTKLLISY